MRRHLYYQPHHTYQHIAILRPEHSMPSIALNNGFYMFRCTIPILIPPFSGTTEVVPSASCSVSCSINKPRKHATYIITWNKRTTFFLYARMRARTGFLLYIFKKLKFILYRKSCSVVPDSFLCQYFRGFLHGTTPGTTMEQVQGCSMRA